MVVINSSICRNKMESKDHNHRNYMVYSNPNSNDHGNMVYTNKVCVCSTFDSPNDCGVISKVQQSYPSCLM